MYAHVYGYLTRGWDAFAGFCGWPGWSGNGFFWPGGMYFGGLLSIIIFILVIGGVVFLLSRLSQRETPQATLTTGTDTGTASALETLKKRLAAGEITEQEYERIKKLIEEK